jgi:hypothetical protein
MTQQATAAEKVASLSFLGVLADEVHSRYASGTDRLCLVFPNRRAGLFFKQHFSARFDKPVWAPEILGIRDFILKESRFAAADRLTLLFRLYEVFRRYNPSGESFDRFFPWGEMLLRDFDELDKYMVNADHLFRYLQEYKAIDTEFSYLDPAQLESLRYFWDSVNTGRYSGEKKVFQDLWTVLHKIYTGFRNSLRAENIAYDGMASRELAENVASFSKHYSHIIFAGFNSLNRCEESILKALTDQNLASVYWDADQYYLNERHEAGRYIRRYHKLFRNSHLVTTDAFSGAVPRSIHAIGVPLHIGQAKIAGQLLAEQAAGMIPEKTAVILPDEELLLPVLSALPDTVENINITMGYPLRNTSLYSLFESIVEMHAGFDPGKGTYYHRHVISIINHPYILNQDYRRNRRFVESALQANTVFFTVGELCSDSLPPVYKVLFSPLKEVSDTVQYFQQLLVLINGTVNPEEGRNQLEQEYIYHFHTQLKRLHEIIAENATPVTLATFWKLFRKIIDGMSIPFSGEPLRGLQVMGMLETRNLDFDTVFILSMNEGILPPAPSSGSFVPFALRKAFGLPTPDQDDAINAYYFYRLIQRAQNVYLIYNTEADGGKGREKSRFLQQLIMEPALDVKEQTLSGSITLQATESITVHKSGQVKEAMKAFTTGADSPYRLSPSALAAYQDCRLKFYYRYIARLYEPDQVKESVDAAIFGDLLHSVLEQLYTGLLEAKGSIRVEKEDFLRLYARLNDENTLLEAFRKHYSFGQFRIEGRNLLVKEVIRKLAHRILQIDEAYAPFEILGLETDGKSLETDFTLDFPVMLGGEQVYVGLKGKIDRIDSKDGFVRIIDYKSGLVTRGFTDIASLFSGDPVHRNKTVSQALFYALLFREKNPGKPFTAGIYSTREIFMPDFSSRLYTGKGRSREELAQITPGLLDDYKAHLARFFADEMFNPEKPFTQTDDRKSCSNCSYNRICRR